MAIYKLIHDQDADPPAREVVGDFPNREAALAALNAAAAGSKFAGKQFRLYEEDIKATGWFLISTIGEIYQLTVA
jgi:hypothetical protein